MLAVLPLLGLLAGCGAEPRADGPGAAQAADGLPGSPEELEAVLVTVVPSDLPRLPDAALHPPAGAKRLEDVATYAEDPARERAVLEDYGYRFGWERFWGSGSGQGPVTGVFVDQFEAPDGATAYAADLASNDAERYRGVLSENPPDLPEGCRQLVVAEPVEELSTPAAFAWCAREVFSVSVTAMAGTLDEALAEVRAVAAAQLDRLPG
ncbi:hypothetical protein DQ241_12265 [Blastococcus sp. TF02A-30]|nr:hypothetical protein DQ241_12265 [Blastococcus sp. TF02A-30]